MLNQLIPIEQLCMMVTNEQSNLDMITMHRFQPKREEEEEEFVDESKDE